MGVSITDDERPNPFHGDFDVALAALQQRLAKLQLVQRFERKRAIILFEGWEGAGKKTALRDLTGSWDPCHFTAHCTRRDEYRHSQRHWLAPYWASLPAPGDTSIFFRSWYRVAVDARVLTPSDEPNWTRALDEINEFEAQQSDHGTLLIKLFFQVSADVQEERLRLRVGDPWLKWTVTAEDLVTHSGREPYLAAWNEMFAHCDTRWAPWRVIESSDDQSGRIAALTAVAEAIEEVLPAEPHGEQERIMPLTEQRRA